MAHNTLSPEHPVDASGAALVASATRLELSRQALEDLDRYPESAGEILLEEAGARCSSGQAEQAVPILDALMEHAPQAEDRQYAATEKLGVLFDGQDPRARAGAERLLADLTAPGVLREGPGGVLAELLVEHGRLEEALRCYNVAARKHLAGSAEDLDQVALLFAFPLIGRAKVRAELGYAPDEFDRAVRDRAEPEDVLQGLVGRSEPALDSQEPHPGRPGHRRGHQVLCSREDFDLARERGLLSGEHAEKGADDYFRAGERVLREYSREHPDLDWHTALFSVREIEEFARSRGADASDRQLRGEWGGSLGRDDPRLRPWPPERNKPCWCASGRKYKKCCGSPNPR